MTNGIAHLNDVFRSTLSGGMVVHTPGVVALDEFTRTKLMKLIRTFNDFGEGNDPHGEHDFGLVSVSGRDFFWKIDYYDLEMKNASPEPNNPKVTTRVLTVMRSDEY